MASPVASNGATARTAYISLLLATTALFLSACGGGTATASAESQAPASISSNDTTAAATIAPTTSPTEPTAPPTGDAPNPPTTATDVPATTEATAPPATTTLDGIADNGFPVIKYFEASQRICDSYAAGVGNGPPDPARFVGATIDSQVDEYRTVIVDGTGTRFVINIEEQPPTIALEDNSAALPFDISFGCPPELYVGFTHD